MRKIPRLELHLTHSCNLFCESCSHYSNHGHKGMLSLNEAESWLAPWAARLEPDAFSLLGGEPSLHPQLPEFVPLVRRYFPRTQIRIVTNGFFLHRHPALPVVLENDPDVLVYLSIHHDSPGYRQRLKPIRSLLREWKRRRGIRVIWKKSYENWTRRYHGYGSSMEPFDQGNPRASWEICPARTCPQLHHGRIWKCAPIAYLGLQDRKYGLSESWTPYLNYRPLEPDCSDNALHTFFDREEESVCAMCPAVPDPFELSVPLEKPRGGGVGAP